MRLLLTSEVISKHPGTVNGQYVFRGAQDNGALPNQQRLRSDEIR